MAEVSTNILIVGAGLAGASTAYHLQRSSDLRVLIVEQESVAGVHSSGRNAALLRAQIDEPDLSPLAEEGAAFLRQGELAGFDNCGLMLLGAGDEPVSRYFPIAQGTGAWCPRDGVIDVAALLQSYLAGQEVRYDVKVLDWEKDSGGLNVKTTVGEIRCDILVNAAGPWAGCLGGLPLTPKNRHVFVTHPCNPLIPGGHLCGMWPTAYISDLNPAGCS